MSKYTAHIKSAQDVYNTLTNHVEEIPANQMQAGCSRLYKRYTPFIFDVSMRALRQAGHVYMKYVLGFSRTLHKTEDGYYSVWTHTVSGTKPFVFFPGLGLGAVPYAKFAKKFGRTVHIVEVPNIGYTMSLSNSHATPKSLYEVVSKHVSDAPDIFAHSLGSLHTAMYLNMIHDKDTPKHNVIVCEGCNNICDLLPSHTYTFVGADEYSSIRKKPKYWLYFPIFIRMAMHDLEFQIFSKRYHNFYYGTLWRDYPNAKITNVYAKYDILYDTEYISEHSDCMVIPKGSHGYSIFGKEVNMSTYINMLSA